MIKTNRNPNDVSSNSNRASARHNEINSNLECLKYDLLNLMYHQPFLVKDKLWMLDDSLIKPTMTNLPTILTGYIQPMCGLCLHYLQKGFPVDTSSGWLEQSMAMAMVIAMCWRERQPTLCCTYVLISKENNTRDACVTVCGLRRPEFNEWVHYSISALNNDPHHTNRTPPHLQ